ncbi:CRISP/Allergen/PR-1-like [Argiope bruennichi]|uniref:CRISP/Allergen/PR-1-like n=1 Tax=Argiope bruennichi TaxID=94029 RepID=UPI0024959228|nr:CRISP/Allergen/PR-1-like [Argiope bruennichi]XP_055927924.1 CRISP/Allergen/PR-1-like [Argiope bruennichi]XP_055927925.1 CRISP/Allergen/PR-1-like [Argiope bruennichi]XP_055927927.1 CRISP/Allergen/PR-1-like [Argiope bruennichi]XP_055927928.1 CRISP/Allergen/PR-1-like [Argiope bruennichi]
MILSFLAVGLVSLNIIGQIAGQECPAIFERYCAHHSACLSPNSNCEILAYYPTISEISDIVNLHNNRRNDVASGHTNLPPAKNMLQMEWDYELAAVAQSYANQCIYAHDKANCRRVRNFGVGQNIAIQKDTGGHTVPDPDWNFAVNEWFAEIRYFSSQMICPFEPPTQGSQEYRHFSQLAWANSFRVGCGYVLYKEGNVFQNETYTRLYVCNYGPTGNVYGECVYEAGNPCGNCPYNTCCGSSCSYFNSLCRRTNENPPEYPPPQPNLFYCAFQNNDDCENYIDGNPNWIIEPTLGGNYLGIVLDAGDNSTIVFKKNIKPSQENFCVILTYRKGPNKYSDPMANEAQEVLYIPERNYMVNQALPGYDNPSRQQFSTYNLTLSWDLETQFKISFAVPAGATPQFLNVKSILAVDGACENKS